MTKIKPCPFCGSEAKIIGGPEDWIPTFLDPDSGGHPYQVHCVNCDAYVGFFYEVEEAIEVWNRRAE